MTMNDQGEARIRLVLTALSCPFAPDQRKYVDEKGNFLCGCGGKFSKIKDYETHLKKNGGWSHDRH